MGSKPIVFSRSLTINDIRRVISSKITMFTIILMVILAVVVAIVTVYSPEGLKNALESAMPGSAGLFESIWFSDVMTIFFPLIITGYGTFILSEIDEGDMIGLFLSRPESRASFLIRRALATMVSFILVYFTGIAVVTCVAGAAVGGTKALVFLWHHILLFPLCFFILGMTFFVSVPLRNTTSTVILSFAVCLFLYFSYAFLLTTGNGLTYSFNPMAIYHGILVNASIIEPIIVSIGLSCILFIFGSLWFVKKDL